MVIKAAFHIIALLLLVSPTLAAVDDPIVTLASPADVSTRRASLINVVYGANALPTTQAMVTTGVANPYGATLPNVARVDQYVASMSNGQSNTSLLYVANSPTNRRVVIVNMGHQFTCSWPSFDGGYGTTPLLQALLSAGYSVFAFNMPNCGDYNAHDALFSSYGSVAWQYFLEPAIQAMNYWDAHRTFSRYDYVGLSGGGWTGAVLSALDRRVIAQILVAGSMPGIQYVSSQGDMEQNAAALYSVAGYLDMYLMAAYGVNHRQVQILNVADDCCFGPGQWNGTDASHYNMNWWQFLSFYSVNLASGAASATILPWRYTLYEDLAATQHQISPWALGIILNVLTNATGGTHR